MEPLKRAASGYDYIEPAYRDEWDLYPRLSRQEQRRERYSEELQRRREEEALRQQQLREEERRRAEKERKKMLHPKDAGLRRKALAYCASILLVSAILITIVSRYAFISTTRLENLEMQNEITALEGEIQQIKIELEAQETISNVQKIASEEMNMGFPTISQVRYITLPEEKPAEEHTSIWQKLGEAFQKAFS